LHADISLLQSLTWKFSLTGDLTKPVEESGLLQQFALPTGLDLALDDSLSLNVGGDGIIGRRVTMMTRGEMVADGIVGFNSALTVVAA